MAGAMRNAAPASIQSGQATLVQALHCVDCGIVIVSEAMRPVFINDRAARIIAAADGLRITDNILVAGRRNDSRKTVEAVRLVARDGVSRRRVLVERPSCRPPLILTVLAASHSGMDGDQAAAVIFIRESDEALAIDRAAIGEAFDLTSRESEIAALLAGGMDLAAVAAALAIGLGTVRNHLKRIFEKTGSHRQSELITLARGFADPAR